MQESGQARASDPDDDGIAGGLGMFEDEDGKGEGWAAPQIAQKPKPKKLTGPWGDYGGAATGAAAQKGSKKRPGIQTVTHCLVLFIACV